MPGSKIRSRRLNSVAGRSIHRSNRKFTNTVAVNPPKKVAKIKAAAVQTESMTACGRTFQALERRGWALSRPCVSSTNGGFRDRTLYQQAADMGRERTGSFRTYMPAKQTLM
jgi:hypothetical protein